MEEDKTLEQLLRDSCQEYFEAECKGAYGANEMKHYIFEAALKFCLGDDVWDKIKVGKKKHAIEEKKKEIEAIQRSIDAGTK